MTNQREQTKAYRYYSFGLEMLEYGKRQLKKVLVLGTLDGTVDDERRQA